MDGPLLYWSMNSTTTTDSIRHHDDVVACGDVGVVMADVDESLASTTVLATLPVAAMTNDRDCHLDHFLLLHHHHHPYRHYYYSYRNDLYQSFRYFDQDCYDSGVRRWMSGVSPPPQQHPPPPPPWRSSPIHRSRSDDDGDTSVVGASVETR